MEQIGSLLTNIFKPDGASAASSAAPAAPAAAPAADAPVVIAVIGAGRMGGCHTRASIAVLTRAAYAAARRTRASSATSAMRCAARRKVDGGDGAPPKYDIVTWKDRAAVERKALLAPDAAGLSAALRRAAQLHDVQVVDTMLKAGVSLYTCDDSANTALILACSASHRHEKAAAKPPQRSATRSRASATSHS